MSTLGPEARALVDAGRSALRPTDADRERVLGALLARIPASEVAAGDSVTGATAGGDAAVSGEATVQATAGKGVGWLVLSGAVVGLGVIGAVLLWSPGRTAAPLPAPTVALPMKAPVDAPAVVTTAPSTSVTVPVGATAEEPTRVPKGASNAAARAPSDRLAEEVAILSRAEKELHAGRFASALSALDEHQRKFPRGTLSQERVAVRIHALCGLGRVAEATAALNRLSPGSPHKGRARAACAANQTK